MSQEPYLLRLTARLMAGLGGLPQEQRQKHAAYILSQQQADGGFPGREGGSDLYYTSFALRSLAALGELTPEVCTRAADFLRDRMSGSAQVVDFFSLILSHHLVYFGGGPNLFDSVSSDWRERIAALLERFRAADGGYARHPGGPHGSTYTSFLVVLTLQLLDQPIPQAARLVDFVRSRRRADGGYAEFAVARRGQTNLTAAAIALLQMLDALDDDAREAAIQYLLAMAAPGEGGLMAHARIPFPDLLSTFTGTWTLDQLGAADQLDWMGHRRFLQLCEQPQGGFRGAALDEQADVEYTFYGLGTLALANIWQADHSLP